MDKLLKSTGLRGTSSGVKLHWKGFWNVVTKFDGQQDLGNGCIKDLRIC